MIEDQKKFYNKESEQYSKKRYEGQLLTYVQFLFRRRRDLLLKMIQYIIEEKKKISVFEVGCADGVILQSITEHYPTSIEKMLGIDISEGMIQEARRKNRDDRLVFLMRGEEGNELYDVVLELGVHTDNLSDELVYLTTHLKAEGYCIYSAASKTSVHAKYKLKDTSHLLSYNETEAALVEHFQIIKSVPYGLFVPKLWAIPLLGRIFQPLVDVLLRTITPQLFHEKIYLLKKKD